MKKKVLLGMSGGIDSTVSAFLLKKQGYEVIGCTMNLWENESNNVVEEAKNSCNKLNIKHIVIDAKNEFKEKVIKNFIEEYKEARTPNPCVECNRYLKFGLFFEKAREIECDYIATGHYAKIVFSDYYNQYILKKSPAGKKDQSYFLYTIPKESLSKIIFPLQEYADKDDIREIARKNKLHITGKKESQEICFIENNNYKEFLNNVGKIENNFGDIVLVSGEKVGKHNGLINYTIGQRKGIGVTYNEPLYVISLDKNKNQVIVGVEKELYKKELFAHNLKWTIPVEYLENEKIFAKVRYRAEETECKIYLVDDSNIKVNFIKPQRAITPGQSIVFYNDKNVVLGGGIIKHSVI